MPIGKIEFRRRDQLIPNPDNARTHDDEQVAQVAASIREFGFTNAILIGPDNVIIAGHARWLASGLLALDEVPVIVLEHLTPIQRRALALADNKLALNAGWNEDLLRRELEELQGLGVDPVLIGFDSSELDALGCGLLEDERLEEVPPAPEVAIASLGDLWLLGCHRVMCGDATDATAVERLLAGQKPRLLVTDPPYGVELDTEWRDRRKLNKLGPAEPSYMKRRSQEHTETSISGDTIADWSPAFALLPWLEDGYVWHASRFTTEVLAGLLRLGFDYYQQIIWCKTQAAMTRTQYWFQHENCWHVRKKNAPWYGIAGENTTVWHAASPKMIMGGSEEEKYDHPTQKPIELMRRPILNHTRREEIVYEPFLGSGTTLAAAEGTGRICYGMELDPKYVDVVVRRWQQLSGQAATLEGDGRTFDQIGESRQA